MAPAARLARRARFPSRLGALGSRLGAAEMVRSGVTTFCDMYFFEDDVATASTRWASAASSGRRSSISRGRRGWTSSRASRTPPPRRTLARPRDRPGTRAARAVHVSPADQRLHALAERQDVPLVTHLAETQEEQQQIHAQYGPSPVRHLANLGLLDRRLIAAHCVWVDGERSSSWPRAGGRRAQPAQQPEARDGIAPVPAMLPRA